jgi:copper(I)-binding protein
MVPAFLALALTAAAVVSIARNSEVSGNGITVAHAWARATPPGANVGAVYLTIENRGRTADRLQSITSPAASSAMLHETVEQDGISQMREASGEIAPGTKLEMKPGGTHIMLMGLLQPLKEGEAINVALDFERAGELNVYARVAPIGADGPIQAME